MQIEFRGENLAVVREDETVYLLEENELETTGNYSFTVLENGPGTDYNPIEKNIVIGENEVDGFESYEDIVDAVLEKYGVETKDTNQNLISSELERLEV